MELLVLVQPFNLLKLHYMNFLIPFPVWYWFLNNIVHRQKDILFTVGLFFVIFAIF